MDFEFVRLLIVRILFIIVWIIFLLAFYVNFSLFRGNIKTKGVPYVGTMRTELKILKTKLKLENGKTLLDLGCGDGKILRLFVSLFKLKQADGYEINHFAYLLGKIINKIKKYDNINIFYKNFKTANLNQYDYIYMYLFPKTMAENEDWIFNNIKDDAIIIVNSFQFPNHKPFKVLQNHKGKDSIFLYKKTN